MSLFFETIKSVGGKLQLLDLHSERLNKTRAEVFGVKNLINLFDEINLPCEEKGAISKVKVTYGKYLESIEIEPYSIKSHKKVKLIENPELDYKYKSTDRSALKIPNNQELDDVIFLKNGFLTDSSYCNLVFFDGQKWVTPSTFLLPGVKRQALLLSQKIEVKEVKFADLVKYSKIAFINAMRDFEKTYTFVIEDDILYLELSA